MSSDKEFQGKETETSNLYSIVPLPSLENLNTHYRDPIASKFDYKAQNTNHTEEKEEEKDQIQEICNSHLKVSGLGSPHNSLYPNRRQLITRPLSGSPRRARPMNKSSFRHNAKGSDYENEMGTNIEDTLDFTSFNHDSTRNGITLNGKKSPKYRTPIPLMKPLPENRENHIQKMIEEAEPNTLIHLPPMIITLPYLYLTKPVTIKGTPGSEIKITEGSIIIDLKNEKGKTGGKVVFCECTIHAEYSRQRLLDNINTRSDTRRGGMTHKESEDSFKLMGQKFLSSGNFNTVRNKLSDSSLVLFQVNSGSALEVRDCNIRSFIKETLLASDETKHLNEIQDTSFWLHNDDDTLENPVLMVSSTTLNGFHTCLNSETSCSSLITKCFISGSRGHALNFENPKTAKITENVIEKTMKSAINIKFAKESIDDKQHNIVIKNNEINHSSSYGISIFGEHLKPLNVSMLIDFNKISYSKKDSLGIKFLNIPELKISHNTIRGSKGNGISLQNVFDTTNSTQLYLRKNVIDSCEGNGVILKDCPVLMEYEEITQNNKNGLFIVLEDYGKDVKEQTVNVYQKLDFRVVLNNCKIHQNKESGINLFGCLKGPMILNSCVMSENLYGIYITEKENSSNGSDSATKLMNTSMNKLTAATIPSPTKIIKHRNKSKSQSHNQKPITMRNHCHFSVEKCEIIRNNIAGIYLKKLISELYSMETHVNMNKEQALFMEDFNDHDQIKLKEQEKARLHEYFHGYVGGYWGELYEERPASCKNNCNMF